MANDTALDWVASRAEAPLAAAIEDTLQNYLAGEARPAEAEAAVALLINYASGPHEALRYRGIDLRREAIELGLWELAVEVVRRAIADADWIQTWLAPQAKLGVLEDLLLELNAQQVAGP